MYDHWSADLASTTDYYPGGMMMPGRNTEYSWSRMGYNGQAKDDEVYGKGNLNTAAFWEMDTRILRRWDVDPVDKASLSGYSVFANNPITYSDPNGLDSISFNRSTIWNEGGDNVSSFKVNITPKPGKDIFTYTNSLTLSFKDGGSITNSSTETLHPKLLSDDKTNFGKANDIWFDGLYVTSRQMYDYEAVGAVMNAYPAFNNYMVSRNSESSIWATLQMANHYSGSFLPVVTWSAAAGFGSMLKAGEGVPQFKWMRGTGGNINGFTISKGSGYGARPRFDFHKLSNTFNSRATSRMTIPKWLDGKKLPHWHRGKGNNLKYHRPWEIGPDGKRKW